jgi:signal transduction histidine kinase
MKLDGGQSGGACPRTFRFSGGHERTESVVGRKGDKGEGSRRRRAVGLACAGVVGTAVTSWGAAISPTFVDPTGLALWRGAIIAAYWGVGVYTWWRGPESRLGRVILILALLYAAQVLVGSPTPLVYTLGMVVWAASIVYTAYVFLCFPGGRLESDVERWFIRAYCLATAVVWALILALSPALPPGGSFVNCGTRCPPNALQIVDGHAATGSALTTSFDIVFTIALIGLATLIVGKALSSSAVRRRAIVPLAVAFLADIVEFVVALFVLPSYPSTAGALKVANGVVTLAVPCAILIGQARADRFAAKTLGQIALGASGEQPMTPVAVQTLIGEALGDPTMRLALWDRHGRGYLDVRGAPVQIPASSSARRVTHVTRHAQPVAALIHDPAFDADADLVAGLTATCLILLENTRLVEELRASRARLVSAAERERRRLERDLHDGAQQQLVVVQVYLRLARQESREREFREKLAIAEEHAEIALQELRELSHGVYPRTLRDHGPAVALRGVADNGIGRLPQEKEAALYFCAREAIQNATKHAGPDATITVTLTSRDGLTELVIADTGVGMKADRNGDGMGMLDMRDRIDAAGGNFTVVSSPRQGTTIHAIIPTAEPIRQSAPIPGELITEQGPVPVQTPNDRNGTFAPQIVRKRQRTSQ